MLILFGLLLAGAVQFYCLVAMAMFGRSIHTAFTAEGALGGFVVYAGFAAVAVLVVPLLSLPEVLAAKRGGRRVAEMVERVDAGATELAPSAVSLSDPSRGALS